MTYPLFVLLGPGATFSCLPLESWRINQGWCGAGFGSRSSLPKHQWGCIRRERNSARLG